MNKYVDEINNLDDLSYKVTQKKATEPPFTNRYNDNFKKGIYVDKISREVLFFSTDKFESGCGWPSFSKPVNNNIVDEVVDTSHNMIRTEVRSKKSNSHLGHVFNDGPKESGGLRYCINSAALDFISYEEMKDLGYEKYMHLIK